MLASISINAAGSGLWLKTVKMTAASKFFFRNSSTMLMNSSSAAGLGPFTQDVSQVMISSTAGRYRAMSRPLDDVSREMVHPSDSRSAVIAGADMSTSPRLSSRTQSTFLQFSHRSMANYESVVLMSNAVDNSGGGVVGHVINQNHLSAICFDASCFR